MSWKSVVSSQITIVSGVSFVLYIYLLFHTSLINVTRKSEANIYRIRSNLEEERSLISVLLLRGIYSITEYAIMCEQATT